MLDEDYNKWLSAKRPFTSIEVSSAVWDKHSDHGHSFKVILNRNGKLTEYSPSNPDDTWEGDWKVEDGILQIKVGKYELSVVANKEGDTHSGVEMADGAPNAYFTVSRHSHSKIIEDSRAVEEMNKPPDPKEIMAIYERGDKQEVWEAMKKIHYYITDNSTLPDDIKQMYRELWRAGDKIRQGRQ